MSRMEARRTGSGFALAAALLFVLSAPAAKRLAGTVDPWLLAGLLYLGSGIGLGLYRLAQRLLGRETSEAPLAHAPLRHSHPHFPDLHHRHHH
jgi:drug/metabolite transporter (DMT)-like permease